MNKIDEKHRYHRTKKSNDEDLKRRYNNKHHYSSSRHDERLNNNNKISKDSSNQRSQRNDYQYQQSNSNTYSYFPVPPPPPPPLMTVVPHERESWIRSVKKTKITESTEQKTQYLETMLRMPQQQKSSINSSTFDRLRFASDQILTTPVTSNAGNNNLDDNSFHLINDINNHDDICTLEKILFNNQLQTSSDTYSTQHLSPSSSFIIDCEPTLKTSPKPLPGLGFLIDNCDEEVELPPSSPPSCPLPPPPPEESIQPNQEDLNEQRVMLVNELDTADVEQRQELKRQKRLHKKLQKKKKRLKQAKAKLEEEQQMISTVNNDNQELSSDWIIEYNSTGNDPISQLTDMVRRTSTSTITDEDKVEKVNMILKKIKKQQTELRKLRQYVMAMLDQQETQNSTNTNRKHSNINQDLLLTFLNQPIISGCWLCSGKTYSEVATQCNHVNEQ